MATKSILKNICIEDRRTASKFAEALERATKRKTKQAVVSKPCNELLEEDILKAFGETNGTVQPG